MKLPAPDEYQRALTHPRLAFTDSDLKSSVYEEDIYGLPRATMGGFAAIFHLHKGKSHWAVRCFYRHVPEYRRRYEAIGQFLKTCPDPVFVEAGLLNDGILVHGQRYPIIKMAWIDGTPLNLYLESNISKPQAISWLPDAFLSLTGRLRELGIAHGDLQHGNIMVTEHSLKLIDYDGVYLPALKGVRSNQQGHPNYQLPSRFAVGADEYGPEMDRFSAIIIYIALKATVESPPLWMKYSDGENLLFRQSDFVDPRSSDLMFDLEQTSALKPLIPKLRTLCALRTEDVPVIDDFLSGRWHPPVIVPPSPQPPLPPIFEVLEASDTTGLLGRVGLRVTVIGQITDMHEDRTRYGQPYVFLNFGDYRTKRFHLVVWSGTLDLFAAQGLRISSYKGKWISITGILSSFKNSPQIEVEMPSQIEVLSGSQEASNRLKGIFYPKTKKSVDSTRANARDMMKATAFNYVVAHRDEYPSANTIAKSLGIGPGMLKDLLDELVREGKIKRNDLTTGVPIRPGTPPGFFPTSGSQRSPSGTSVWDFRPVQSGSVGHVGSQVPSATGATRKLTRKEADILNKLWGKGTSPAPQQPISSGPATKMIPSPNLCVAGTLSVASALLLAVLRVYAASLVFVILGCSAVYYALTHYSILVPVKVISQTSTYARSRGRCKGCGSTIQTGSLFVKTERGAVHPWCVGSVEKRVWKSV